MSGKALAGLIALSTLPIVARFFDPEHFGIAALFVSTLSIVATFATMSYASAVVLPHDDGEAVLLMALAYRMLALVCTLMLFAIAVAHWTHLPIKTLEILGACKWLLPLGLLLVVAVSIQEYWLTRKRLFNQTSLSLVAGNAGTGISRIALGALSGSTSVSLISGYMFGQFLRLCIQWRSCGHTVQAALWRMQTMRLRDVARRYVDFPVYKMPTDFVYSVGSNLPTLLLGAMFSPAVAGFFAMAKGLLQAPVKVVSNSVSRVFFQKAASIRREGRSLWRAYWLLTISLALTGILPFLVIFYSGQSLTTWLLGDKWIDAGQYVEVIAPWLLMAWVTVPSKAVYVIFRRQKLLLILETILTLFRLGAFGVGYLVANGPINTLQMYVGVTVMINLIIMLVGALLVYHKK